MMQYLMGIDVGGSVAKAAIYDIRGKEICAAGKAMDTLTPQPEYRERDTEQIRNSIYDAVAEVLKNSGVKGKEIAAIGVTGQANGLYMFDRNGVPTYPAILSSDMRAKEFVRSWNTMGVLDEIIPKTRQILWAGQTPAIIAWFASYDPDTLEKTDVFLTAKDYARFLLTGNFSLECTEASSMSLMDLETRRLSHEIMQKLGIERYENKFPSQILESTEIGGFVTKSCAECTGLIPGTPVAGGLIDTVACMISQGVVQEEQLGMIIGTWGVNAFITKRPLYSKNLFSAFYYCLPGYHLILEGSSTSATNLEWFIKTFLKQNGMNFCGYEKINEMIATGKEQNHLIFLPFLFGTNVSIDATAAFVGLDCSHGISDLLRAIYEGVVFCHMDHIDRLLEFRDKPQAVRISGGGARSEVWMQMFADALGLTVEVSEAQELGALGASMAAGVGVGIFNDFYEAAAELTKIKKRYEPAAEKHSYYQRKYAIYRKLIEALDPIWNELSVLELQD